MVRSIHNSTGEIPLVWSGVVGTICCHRGKDAYTSLSQYAASKAALHSLSRILETEVAGFGIEVMLYAVAFIAYDLETYL